MKKGRNLFQKVKGVFRFVCDGGRQLKALGERLNFVADQNNLLEMSILSVQESLNSIDVKLLDLDLKLRNEQRKSEIRLMGSLSRGRRIGAHERVISPVPTPVDFWSVIEEFKVQNPSLFSVWYKLFENGEKAYAQTKVGNCSHNELEPALLFRDIIDTFARGAILDVGCGPYDVPSYLMSFEINAISGLEPLPLLTTPSYRVERGFGERIPWQDASFDAVVSGAALDHAFSVDGTLAEIRRVLKPEGRFFLWIASIPGAEEFIETRSSYVAIDDFHVFHFDQKWLDPKLDNYFKRREKFTIRDNTYDHVFYVLERS